MELDTKQFSLAFVSIRVTRRRSSAEEVTTRGLITISVIWKPFLSTFSSLAAAVEQKLTIDNLEFSAIAKNVIIKHVLTDATNRCSGVHFPSCPLNSGGALTETAGKFDAVRSPSLSPFHSTTDSN